MILIPFAGFDAMERPIGPSHPLHGTKHSPLTLAIIGSHMARVRVQRMKWAVPMNPPTATRGRFPFNTRTLEEVDQCR